MRNHNYIFIIVIFMFRENEMLWSEVGELRQQHRDQQTVINKVCKSTVIRINKNNKNLLWCIFLCSSTTSSWLICVLSNVMWYIMWECKVSINFFLQLIQVFVKIVMSNKKERGTKRLGHTVLLHRNILNNYEFLMMWIQ